MKVFISSTYKDLIEYRAAAIRAVEGTNYQASKMEVFGARPNEPLDACLKEVEESELFIGIYALRYGFIPEGADISITEMEYLHAKKLGKTIYCFLLDEENQPWLKKWIESDPGKSKLENFKRRIQKFHVCDYFTTPDDVRAKVSNALSHYVANNPALTRPFGSPSPDGRGERHGSTLPTQPYFFGREKELKIIADAISPESRTWGALIDGPGGIGKTALAIKAGHEAPETIFDRKIFITAKVRELHPEGEKKLDDFTRPNYLAMLNELALELGEEGIQRLAPDERANALRLVLAGKKALIIFDNLETLPEDERVRLFQFLSRLPEGNKAIVTSRRRADVDARIVRLDRLELKEALQLIAELATNNRRLASARNNDRRQLYELTSGNPLFIKWICGQLQRDGSHFHTIAEACAFLEKAPKGNDPLEYIFGDLLETFTESETKVLAALTHFVQPAKLAWIAQMTELAERAAETALEDLADRSILIANNESRMFYLPPLAAQFIKTRRPEVVATTGDVLSYRAYALAAQYGGSVNYDGFKVLDAEWELLESALPRFLQGDNMALQIVCNNLFQFFNFTGRWDVWIWFFEQAERRAELNRDYHNAGWRAYHTGAAYYFRNQPVDVLACSTRASDYWKNDNLREKAFALQLRGHGYRLQGNFPAAIDAYREMLQMWRSINPEGDDVAMALNDLADAERENKDYAAAEHDYHESLRIAYKTGHKEQIAETSGNMASLALDRSQWEEAETLAMKTLPLAEKIGRQELIATICYIIAKSQFEVDRVNNQTLAFAIRAVDIFSRLRLSKKIFEAQEILAEIENQLSP